MICLKKIFGFNRVLAILLLGLVMSLFLWEYGISNAGSFKEKKQKVFRVGYVESEPFDNYATTLFYIVKGLEEFGWLESTGGLPFKPGTADTVKMWDYLSQHSTGSRIEFVADAHYDLSLAPNMEEKLLTRLRYEKDLDLIIVMGTMAGKVVANEKHSVPTFIFSASNAVKSGIIKSEKDSGLPHVWAHMDSGRFARQVRVFHDVAKFQNLGLVYENSEVARGYSAISDIEKVALEKGFKTVSYYVDEPKGPDDEKRYFQEVKEAYINLAPRVDAMYITLASLKTEWLPELLEPYIEHKVPVFSQLGQSEVNQGAMLSVTLLDFPNVGRFGADSIIKALQGARPGQLPQVYQSSPKILVNLDTAEKIQFPIPFEMLLVADEVVVGKGQSER